MELLNDVVIQCEECGNNIKYRISGYELQIPLKRSGYSKLNGATRRWLVFTAGLSFAHADPVHLQTIAMTLIGDPGKAGISIGVFAEEIEL